MSVQLQVGRRLVNDSQNVMITLGCGPGVIQKEFWQLRDYLSVRISNSSMVGITTPILRNATAIRLVNSWSMSSRVYPRIGTRYEWSEKLFSRAGRQGRPLETYRKPTLIIKVLFRGPNTFRQITLFNRGNKKKNDNLLLFCFAVLSNCKSKWGGSSTPSACKRDKVCCKHSIVTFTPTKPKKNPAHFKKQLKRT